MSKSTPQHEGYKKMKDTAWIKQGRKISDAGGKGILSNYNNVNVFDQGTRDSLEARNNAIYQRAFNDMNQNYNKIMNEYAARNYNRFGSLNNTPSSYVIDQYQKDFQRQMNDASYNKAVNYENLVNNELQRRYNTLNMFRDMYGYGQNVYNHDKMNWNVENTNRDIAYQNAMANYQSGGGLGGALGGAISGAGTAFMTTGNPLAALAGGVAGGAMGAMGGKM